MRVAITFGSSTPEAAARGRDKVRLKHLQGKAANPPVKVTRDNKGARGKGVAKTKAITVMGRVREIKATRMGARATATKGKEKLRVSRVEFRAD